MDSNCIFCKIVAKEIGAKIIYENDLVLAFLDIEPVSNGHSLIIPKKHFNNFSEVETPYLEAVSQAKQLVAQKLLSSSLNPQGLNYLSNQGQLAGQSVNHYHEHIIPKYVANEGFNLSVNRVNLNQDLDQLVSLLKIN